MAGALEGLYNHALPIHTPATLLASSTAQGQTDPQVRNTIHCFHFGWEQTTSRDNMSINYPTITNKHKFKMSIFQQNLEGESGWVAQ